MNRADEQIRDQLTDEMTRASIDARNLTVEVVEKAAIIKGTVPDTDQRDRLARLVASSVVSDTTLQWDVAVEKVPPPDSADGRSRSPVTGTSADSRHQSRHQLDLK
jgi:hypothetical protein